MQCSLVVAGVRNLVRRSEMECLGLLALRPEILVDCRRKLEGRELRPVASLSCEPLENKDLDASHVSPPGWPRGFCLNVHATQTQELKCFLR